MKRRTYREIESELTRLSRSESLLSIALNLVMNKPKPDAQERFRIDGSGRYVLRLYGAHRACGGIVVETFYCSGQSPHSAAYYLEDMAQRARDGMEPLSMAQAIARLVSVRNQLTDNGVTNARHGTEGRENTRGVHAGMAPPAPP